MQISTTDRTKLIRISAVGILLAICAVVPSLSPLAQRRSKEKPPKVTEISSRKVANGEVISLSTDSALNGIQSWQDPNGTFHLVLPGSGESVVTKSPKGVKVSRIGNSLEIELQARRGSSVTVEPGFNGLDLVVSGGLEASGNSDSVYVIPAKSAATRRGDASRSMSSHPASIPHEKGSSTQVATRPKTALIAAMPTIPTLPPKTETKIESAATPPVPAPSDQRSIPSPDPLPESSASIPPDEDHNELSIFTSGWWVTLLLVVVLGALMVWRRHDKSGWEDVAEEKPQVADALLKPTEVNAVVDERRQENRRSAGRMGGTRSSDVKATNAVHDGSEASQQPFFKRRQLPSVLEPAALFGAYRVDQEVCKLVLGQAHRIDVLASRGPDDRRAMEASLLKALRSTHTDENGRRKARKALEEYGFVARQSAAILLAADPCERVSAARFLGEVGLPSSLQFLLEALYDTDSTVRTHAIEGIGALRLPSAIGALIDIARKYPDVSNAVVSNALNACSIECLDYDSRSGEYSPYLTDVEQYSSEIRELEPSAKYRELADTSDDKDLAEILDRLQNSDIEDRATAAQSLAIYRVQSSVAALKALTASDEEPAVRAAAVASLGAIDHESVFSSVLVALADEARDVRAAAARAVSRLSFNRADAYARVIEMADEEELSNMAHACVKTGLAAQALDRLASDDRRQAYEAYSVLSLLVKAGVYQPILDLIEKHADMRTCSSAIQILSLAKRPDLAAHLKQLAASDGMHEKLRTELLEVVNKIDHLQPA